MNLIELGSYISIEDLLKDVRQRVRRLAPDLEPLLDDYAGEARFGYFLMKEEIAGLPDGAKIIEIGAGMLLLSCFLQYLGYKVTAIEPIGDGFSHFDILRQIVLEFAKDGGFEPEVRTIPAEQLESEAEFDFAFSLNVMEHVDDVSLVLRRVMSALKTGCGYRFLCPNYLFPYEPHFNIPTLFSKSLTERVFGRWIHSSQKVVDPVGTWASLNWISVPSVRRICLKEFGALPDFDRMMLYLYVMRALNDPDFQRRRGPLIGILLSGLESFGLTNLLKRLPVIMQPAMYCFITK